MSHPAIPAGGVVIGGGIGAGKSSVLDVFERAGLFVVEADSVGHVVLGANHDAGRAVMDRWPSVIVDGEVSRPALARIVFADAVALEELEAITHPAIRAEIHRMASEAQSPVAVEVPIIGMFAEAEWHRIAVVAPEHIRVARAVMRGGDRADVKARIASQPSRDDWIAWADTVIDNGGSWETTRHALESFVGQDEDE